ncbi:DUF3761 domain-containing protein [Dyella sp. KULCS107]|uniref:DUF3761 domain-containing protein n=1 Tax=Dyella sp. KULCS107 TaxID=3422216 RepID=UPI003D6F602E
MPGQHGSSWPRHIDPGQQGALRGDAQGCWGIHPLSSDTGWKKSTLTADRPSCSRQSRTGSRSAVPCSSQPGGTTLPGHRGGTSMRRTARGLLIALISALFAAGISLPKTASSATHQAVVYRCAKPSGQVEYTWVPKVGCTVVAVTQQTAIGEPGRTPGQPRNRSDRSNPVPRLITPTQVGADVPAGASAQCRDGTYSFSRSRRGTCSHHGGVARWL